jgi:hypothetical protein
MIGTRPSVSMHVVVSGLLNAHELFLNAHGAACKTPLGKSAAKHPRERQTDASVSAASKREVQASINLGGRGTGGRDVPRSPPFPAPEHILEGHFLMMHLWKPTSR